jgi:hypothetical protein
MKIRALAAAAAVSVLAPLGTLVTAGTAVADPFANASISNYMWRTGPGTATVTATYVCPEGFHLWISAKQAAGGRLDRRLELEGSSQFANAWLQSHPTDFTCDGTRRTETFTIDTLEQGFGSLTRGVAWVQFCLIGANTFISESEWVAVL